MNKMQDMLVMIILFIDELSCRNYENTREVVCS